jgi:predicted Rossmann fold flavoprotein
VGAKIKVSGGAKCNITNRYLSSDYYLGDKTFIDEVFKKFDNKSLLDFLNKNGLNPKIDEKIVKGTYFCKSSDEPISMFKRLISNTKQYLNCEVLDVNYLDDTFKIQTTKDTIKAKELIVASGGLSYTSLGATGIGFKIAEKFGHTVNKLNPALVGFTVQKPEFWFKELSGLSLSAKIKVEDKVLEGKMLFTHKGCSGPVILSSSLNWKRGNISIDFAPYKESYLPKRFRQATKNIDIDIHNYQMAPAGNFGYTKAEVTKGGVLVDQLTKNFESKYQKGLYFIGEVVDVTGELGGYNFQWAFSSGYSVDN